ncbi:hypothetical protein [Treponema pedis]|uniref:Uncharacterized protein n=1 Tax=Treponema pedis TaxID=409322 RepID=A0A7S6WP71_9SPIR|nr:hypothetical protein [Treponema pedis]QOW60763.1 hypothetical protein IFE08_13415 [Treponema pedis]
MTDITELFSGISIIIDDDIEKKDSLQNGIQKIQNSLKEKQIPFIQYSQLPDDELIKNLHSVSFIILDWNLSGMHPISEAVVADNIEFIKHINKICFVPIFIFSDESSYSIEVELEKENLYSKDICSNIFVKNKSDINNSEQLFSEIENWIKKTPSMYVVKEWGTEKRKAQNQMLWELHSIFPQWPHIISKAARDDGVDANIKLIQILQRGVEARLSVPDFDKDIIEIKPEKVDKKDIRKILEYERFLKGDLLPNNPFSGDVYCIDKKYYLNIRPDCDIVRDEKALLYLLKGNIVDEYRINSEEKDCITFDSGEFIEKNNNCYIAFVNENILEFKFRELEIKNWKEIKSHRIGRLLPPYITKIQQKYSFYLQRQGLPAIPKEAIQ